MSLRRFWWIALHYCLANRRWREALYALGQVLSYKPTLFWSTGVPIVMPWEHDG